MAASFFAIQFDPDSASLLRYCLIGLGLSADVVALTLASARLGANRWAPVAAGVGLLLGLGFAGTGMDVRRVRPRHGPQQHPQPAA